MDKCPHCGSIGQMFKDCDNHHKGDTYCLACGWRDSTVKGYVSPGYYTLLSAMAHRNGKLLTGKTEWVLR